VDKSEFNVRAKV